MRPARAARANDSVSGGTAGPRGRAQPSYSAPSWAGVGGGRVGGGRGLHSVVGGVGVLHVVWALWDGDGGEGRVCGLVIV